LVIWKQPSPSMAQTSLSGAPTLAPIAAGTGVAHRAQATGVEPGARVLVLDELRGPHLVLANARRVDRFRPGDLADPLITYCGQGAVRRLLVASGYRSRSRLSWPTIGAVSARWRPRAAVTP
jgi:hypothetical protein